MVSGFTKFKERFQGFENQYVIIGGTACDLIMENEELPFRATKDVDIVLIVESITAEFGRQFWEMSNRNVDKSSTKSKNCLFKKEVPSARDRQGIIVTVKVLEQLKVNGLWRK